MWVCREEVVAEGPGTGGGSWGGAEGRERSPEVVSWADGGGAGEERT